MQDENKPNEQIIKPNQPTQPSDNKSSTDTPQDSSSTSQQNNQQHSNSPPPNNQNQPNSQVSATPGEPNENQNINQTPDKNNQQIQRNTQQTNQESPEQQTPQGADGQNDDQNQPGWKFSTEQQVSNEQFGPEISENEQPEANISPDKAVSWEASEFIEHEKSAMWYIQFSLAALVVISLIYFLTRDIISVAALGFVAIIFMFVAGRKPRVLSYSIDSQGVHIGNKIYPFSMFKSFTVIEEEAINSITLLPLKRFMPSISLYYEPSEEQKIIDTLSLALPYEDRQQDVVDKFMRKIRF